ncbi:MAG: GNAT family acetyltransferase [Lachnospiraceae bacterium]|nr:GNAT family acetyltransferase [Lachnospiraceae bacterium]
MIDLGGQAGLPYVNRGVYTGSYRGMRYRMCKKEKEEGGKYLEAVIYPEPFCFEVTAEEEKEFREFPFTEEGFDAAVSWLNQVYGEQQERWETAGKGKWV